MTTPLIWLVIGVNGAGKSTYYDHWIAPRTALPFINADRIAAERWPEEADPSALAASAANELRARWIDEGRSFATETVFSHPTRLEILRDARRAGYDRWVTWIGLEHESLAVRRVADRVEIGGHDIPEAKIRARYHRLVPFAAEAIRTAERGFVVDNTANDRPLRPVLAFERGTLTYRSKEIPSWVRSAFAKDLAEA